MSLIAESQITAGFNTQARQTLEIALEFARKATTHKELTALLPVMVKAGMKAKCREIWKEALQKAVEYDSPKDVPYVMLVVAATQVGIGDYAEVLRTVDELLRYADNRDRLSQVEEGVPLAVSFKAVALAMTGQIDEALKLTDISDTPARVVNRRTLIARALLGLDVLDAIVLPNPESEFDVAEIYLFW